MDILREYSINRSKLLLKNENAKDAYYHEKRDKNTGYVLRFIIKKIGFMKWIEYQVDSDYKTIGSKRKLFAPSDKVDLNELALAIGKLE
ncbi:hypothetical protein [Acinetobacter soli]|uniref:hypothetical protein n=1 Tax=Acinetobacter soli TaxID=487316 RepID=UPI00125E39F3|nr:hypothetical protein [Acinetobacter soli]